MNITLTTLKDDKVYDPEKPGIIGFQLVVGKRKEHSQIFKSYFNIPIHYTIDRVDMVKYYKIVCHHTVELFRMLERVLTEGRIIEFSYTPKKGVIHRFYKIRKNYRIENLKYKLRGRE